MQLGTYTTFDAPTDKITDALSWLRSEFEKIDGTVRLFSNSHDFGNYPSFEIDYPVNLVDIDDDDLDVDPELLTKKDVWHDEANKIESNYSKKFEQYL